MIESFKITKIRGQSRESIEDYVAREIPLTLTINDQELVTLLCSPCDLEDLIRGFLFTAGLIRKADDIKKIVINQEQWLAYIDLLDQNITKDLIFKRLYTSGCGRGTLFYNVQDMLSRAKIVSDVTIKAEGINSLAQDFQKKSEIYLKTGGAHSAGLADENCILIFKEDIGRHNAVDKVIGCSLREKIIFENKIMLSSGRVSSEVLFKAQKCRIPFIVSKSAPTNQGVRLARDMGITLIGFARANRMNIYSHEERIIGCHKTGLSG